MIHILTTGGTIEGIDIEIRSGKHHSDKSSASIQTFLDKANVCSPYKIEKVFNKDSRKITLKDRQKLLNAILKIKTKQILITHGTFTMEETAKFLGKQRLDKVVVLVGSFVLGDLYDTDAPFNLGFAMGAIQLLQPDVYITMNGKIFHWSNVFKNLETNRFEYQNE